MKLVRLRDPEKKEINFGVLEEELIYVSEGSPFSKNLGIEKKNSKHIKEIELLSPIDPSKIVAVAINYYGATGHSSSMSEPLVFMKGSNAITTHGKDIRLPFTSNTWGECELGVVIKQVTSIGVNKDNIKDFILGYIPANDVSCNNVDGRDHHLAKSKSVDSFCPVGPYIDTTYNFKNKYIEAYQNKVLLRKGNTDEMIWDPEKIIIWLSSWMTLYPGDLVLTGTPPRLRDRMFLKSGDIFTVKIEGFPALQNKFYE